MIITKVYPKLGAIAQNEKIFSNNYSQSWCDEIKRLTEMAEIAAYCHALTPIKVFLWFLIKTADSGLKRSLWRFLFFDSPPKRSPAVIGTIAIRGGLK
jgi:hypothetical protein